MAFTEVGAEGSLNGATAVDIIPVPAASHRLDVTSVRFYNKDTAAVTITIVKDKAGTDHEIAKETLEPGESWQPITAEAIEVLDATDEKIQAFMSGAAATTNPTYTGAYADVS